MPLYDSVSCWIFDKYHPIYSVSILFIDGYDLHTTDTPLFD
ncbi:hypothetical protein NT01EI_2662 [Edwardsiella ictaluri 93-146]|uniref:Uncharacterized protein n=1 Tax=Edwardsiella ictaluri (strain 93-146) TaxID=634503 RepID=C5B7J4_EDWI9|nr:hypothetical protein NT01EI_2662 [Edwardsiella ictaluri 93-146]